MERLYTLLRQMKPSKTAVNNWTSVQDGEPFLLDAAFCLNPWDPEAELYLKAQQQSPNRLTIYCQTRRFAP